MGKDSEWRGSPGIDHRVARLKETSLFILNILWKGIFFTTTCNPFTAAKCWGKVQAYLVWSCQVTRSPVSTFQEWENSYRAEIPAANLQRQLLSRRNVRSVADSACDADLVTVTEDGLTSVTVCAPYISNIMPPTVSANCLHIGQNS